MNQESENLLNIFLTSEVLKIMLKYIYVKTCCLNVLKMCAFDAIFSDICGRAEASYRVTRCIQKAKKSTSTSDAAFAYQFHVNTDIDSWVPDI